MYRTKTNQEIRRHLTELIKNSGYGNDRQFAIAYLRKRDGREPSMEEIQRMQNRLCQMKTKSIQIEDLPIFAELLGVSVDNILSAGTYFGPPAERATNYSIAMSDDPKAWEEYVKRPDKLILNPDEYNKTVIDYALEHGNYALLKFLMDNKHIWFVGEDPKQYGLGFGAGTDIKRRDFGYMDVLDSRMKENDDLRSKMVALAIRNKDIAMLEKLRAREIPALYHVSNIYGVNPTRDRIPESDNVQAMIESVACAPKQIRDYFFREFQIENSLNKKVNTFFFPYAGAVIERMIKEKKAVVVECIEKVIAWNRNIQKRLLQAIDESKKGYEQILSELKYPDPLAEKRTYHVIWEDYILYSELGYVSYTKPMSLTVGSIEGLISNAIRVNANSKDDGIQAKIDELNDSYNVFGKYMLEKEERKNERFNL